MRMIIGASAIAVVWLVGVTRGATDTQISRSSSMASVDQPDQTKRRPALWLVAGGPFALGSDQATTAGPLLAEQAFKNIQALKGIPVDDFMGTMGIMSGSLGFDCSECHDSAGTDKVNWAADTPRKVTARRMVNMVTAINRDNFSGRQVVTCWTCHRGRDRPVVTPTLEVVYGTPILERDDLVPASPPGLASPDQIINKYLQALGGAERLARITSFAGKGTSVGFGGFGGGGAVQIYSKAPDQRTAIIEFKDAPGRDASIRSYDGKIGWIKTPLTVLGEYQLNGSELDGARLDALLSFPAQIKQALTNLRTLEPATIDDREVDVVQGNGPRRLFATLYFDKQTGLLTRMVRYGNSPIGRLPTQIDYSDYRDVGGIKMPFRFTFAWLDGRDAFQLNDVQVNVPIDAAKFGRPTSLESRP
jgi:photosynthetic reaction center cytochrome c subunit